MTSGQFKNHVLNGGGLSINRGTLTEFGYYNNGELRNNLIDYVYWYATRLQESGRGNENMLNLEVISAVEIYFHLTKNIASFLFSILVLFINP